jgi:hypothetical protein
MDQEKLKRMQQAAQNVRIGEKLFYLVTVLPCAPLLLPKGASALPRCILADFLNQGMPFFRLTNHAATSPQMLPPQNPAPHELYANSALPP